MPGGKDVGFVEKHQSAARFELRVGCRREGGGNDFHGGAGAGVEGDGEAGPARDEIAG